MQTPLLCAQVALCCSLSLQSQKFYQLPIIWSFLVPKFVDNEPASLELFDNVAGVHFWDTVSV